MDNANGLSWLLDFQTFVASLVWIRRKDKTLGKLVPNNIQLMFLANMTQRNVIVKPRQVGFSTLLLAWGLHQILTIEGHRHVVIAHKAEATQQLKERLQLMFDKLPARPRTDFANRRELAIAEMGSAMYVGTAGGREFGRSDTIHSAHVTEYAFWPDNTLKVLDGLMESVPMNGRIDLESTPNGLNHFYGLVKAAEKREGSNWTLHFYPWYLFAEYALPLGTAPLASWDADELALAAKAMAWGVVLSEAQVAWRRFKRKDASKFAQEYPEDIDTCFLASGRPVFDNNALHAHKQKLATTKPVRVERVPHTDLTVTVWQEPQSGGFYIGGADAAQGLAAGDSDSLHIVDWDTGKTVLTVHGKADIFLYAQECVKWATRYNRALLAIERKESGIAVIQYAKETLGYSNLFQHEDHSEPGFDTNSRWRPVVISTLEEWARGNLSAINCPDTLEEMMRFVINHGKAQAASGAHDDRVMSQGIALTVRDMVRPPRREKSRGRAYSAAAT